MGAENPEKIEFTKSDNFKQAIDGMFDDDKITPDELKKLNDLKKDYEKEKGILKKRSKIRRGELTREMIILAIKELPEYKDYHENFNKLSLENRKKRQQELWYDLKEHIDGKFGPKTFFKMYQYGKNTGKLTKGDIESLNNSINKQKLNLNPLLPFGIDNLDTPFPQTKIPNPSDPTTWELPKDSINIGLSEIPKKIGAYDVYKIINNLTHLSQNEKKAIELASQEFGISTTHILAKISVESTGRKGSISGAGAKGLMQVMPGTLAGIRKNKDFREAIKRNNIPSGSSAENIFAGTYYLFMLKSQHPNWDFDNINRAYNAGPGKVLKGEAFSSETIKHAWSVNAFANKVFTEKVQLNIGINPNLIGITTPNIT
ncbi:lytic transglycosylase domain-containing protein [Candidatus Gracilibacteria bacterium]|nr:lytic transglycosylase domain-containing protein [Candidatus Gracilibacteria bacterium]NUJ99452.1 lytic transglycosylase domain-containing protein [Candidatus Gracilibacteria bacterium]